MFWHPRKYLYTPTKASKNVGYWSVSRRQIFHIEIYSEQGIHNETTYGVICFFRQPDKVTIPTVGVKYQRLIRIIKFFEEPVLFKMNLSW